MMIVTEIMQQPRSEWLKMKVSKIIFSLQGLSNMVLYEESAIAIHCFGVHKLGRPDAHILHLRPDAIEHLHVDGTNIRAYVLC